MTQASKGALAARRLQPALGKNVRRRKLLNLVEPCGGFETLSSPPALADELELTFHLQSAPFAYPPVTGTPFTHDLGFAAHHIPTFTPAGGPEPALESELLLESGPVAEGDVMPAPMGAEPAAFVTGAPDGATACQIPPTPCPLTSPAFVSPEKR
jgi:hypothetical protein